MHFALKKYTQTLCMCSCVDCETDSSMYSHIFWYNAFVKRQYATRSVALEQMSTFRALITSVSLSKYWRLTTFRRDGTFQWKDNFSFGILFDEDFFLYFNTRMCVLCEVIYFSDNNKIYNGKCMTNIFLPILKIEFQKWKHTIIIFSNLTIKNLTFFS